jgi:uncharacterized protein YjbI with pentapeptide repeats
MDKKEVIARYNDGYRNFNNVKFKGETLNGVDFTGAKLNGVDFTRAKLNDAKFDKADIRGVNFTQSELENASFKEAIVGTQTKWLLLLVPVSVFLLVLSSFPLALAFWWIPFFGISFSSHPIFVFYTGLVLLIFLYLIFRRKTEDIFVWIIGVAAITAGVFGLYGIFFGGESLSVGMVVCTIGLGAGVIVSSTVGAGSLNAVKITVANITNIPSRPNYITNISSKLERLLLIIVSVISIIASYSLTAKCAEIILAKRVLESAMTLMKAHAAKETILITGTGGALSVVLSTYISFLMDNGKYKLANNFSNRITAFIGTNFFKAMLNKTDFTNVIFYCINFEQAKVIQTNWKNTKEHNRIFGLPQILQDKKILALVTRKECSDNFNFVGKNLEGVNLENAQLSGIKFQNANLTNANLIQANLTEANFENADLTNANLKKADLYKAVFVDANLTDAVLQEAELNDAQLVRTQLNKADLTDACITGACIEDLGNTQETKLDGLRAAYIYMKWPNERRLPHEGNLKSSSELVSLLVNLIKQRNDVIELYHQHGLELKALTLAINEVSKDNPELIKGVTEYRDLGDNRWLIGLRLDKAAEKADESRIVEGYYDNYERATALPPEYKDIYLSIPGESLNQLARLLPSVVTWKENRIRLIFGSGSFESGFQDIRLDILTKDGLPLSKRGQLPPISEPIFEKLCSRLKKINYTLSKSHFGSMREIEFEDDDEVPNISLTEIKNLSKQLHNCLNEWLRADKFSPIVKLLNRQNPEDEFIFCIECDDYPQLKDLPWHLWDFFKDYPFGEIAFSTSQSSRSALDKIKRVKRRVLCILGDDIEQSQGTINLTEDRQILEKSLGESVVFLTTPTYSVFCDSIADPDGWDIIVFSGHSSGKWDTLKINQDEQVQLNDLQFTLRKAIRKGLQLFILNSCESLKLAKSLEELSIPQVIAMREPVPDPVAQRFFRKFITCFVDEGLSVGRSVREARESLESFKNHPLATWMPVLCQNYAEYSVLWKDLPRVK